MVEGGGFEPPKLARQIYSLIPLATREPLPARAPKAAMYLGVLFRGGILGELVGMCNHLAEFFSRPDIGPRQLDFGPVAQENRLRLNTRHDYPDFLV